MNFKYLFILILFYFSSINCKDEFLAINCKAGELQYKGKSSWLNYNGSITCPISSEYIVKICNNIFNTPQYNSIEYVKSKSIKMSLKRNFKIYQCSINDKKSEALSVPGGCRFDHSPKEANVCLTEEEWKAKAGSFCINYGTEVDLELAHFSGIFNCKISDTNPRITFKSIQYVCCPKLNAYDFYKIHIKNQSKVKSENQAFLLAKKALRKRFDLRQKQIQDRFILEENSIDFSQKNPKIANFLENKIQDNFRKRFTLEMSKEVDLMKELEIIHENRMQKLFEKNRKSAKARLEYTLQETNPRANRIAKALKLELISILSEAKDVTEFYETLLTEGFTDSERSKILIRETFNSLVGRSWNEVFGLLDRVSELKDEIMKQITDFELQKQNLIKRFTSLDSDKVLKDSVKHQVENHVKNMISLYGHGSANKNELHNSKNQNNFSIANRSIIILLFFLCIMIVISILILLYRFHGKINSYLSTTFKKIHPPTKNLFVHVDNYPFKNRYNYGNGIFQPIFKSEEYIIDHPNSCYNQHFTSVFESSSQGFKKSHQETDFNESLNNINGLENPICRLLDEK